MVLKIVSSFKLEDFRSNVEREEAKKNQKSSFHK